jgi:hypothetical protein
LAWIKLPYKDKEKERENRKMRGKNYYYRHIEVIREKKRKQMEKWRKNNPQLWTARKYGLTNDEAKRLRASPCGLCGKEGPSQIDHDHRCSTCGFDNGPLGRFCSSCGSRLKVRGPLCLRHNTDIGHLEDLIWSDLFERALVWIGMGVE